ncbi:SF3A1 [Symbiodinium microadriaticum]|nr:SF3A1 [Symbiodinium microadriaticum]
MWLVARPQQTQLGILLGRCSMPDDDKSNAGVGLIFPPPDIRGVIDKTAQFVAKCGEGFEQRVLREQNHTKFAFLLPNNPYRPYYEHKVKEFKTGVVEDTKPEVPQAIIDQKAKEDAKRLKKEQLKALTMGEKRKKQVKPPPPDQYVVNHPYIAPMDTDIIKLTAQFVARNGQKFLIGLTQRESRNPQFDFLKPTHALFGYFTSLVDAYTKCLMPNKDEVEKLKKCTGNPQEVVDKAMARFAWDEQEEATRVSREEEVKEEKEQMAQIDWHDFVVVETIEFTAEDENLQLAAPIDPSTHAPKGAPAPLEQAGTMFAEARIEKPVKGVEEEIREEPAVDLEKEERERREREMAEQRERELEREREELREKEERERQQREEEEMVPEEEPIDMEPEIPLPMQEPEMKVRKDYVRQKKGSAQRLMQRCPITGQLIAAEEMSNHLKVLLLDPKWKHQKDALVERARKESAFADDVEANLASFVAKRPDLFGTVEEEIREAAEAGAEAAARDAGADAGPAHTMVPPTAIESGTGTATKALPSGKPGAAGSSALPAPSMPALAGQQGPIAGVSTINARLPQASLVNQQQMPGGAPPGIRPPGMAGGPMALADDDEDDEPTAKKPRLDDGSLQAEESWVAKHPVPIAVIVQVNLGADALAAGIQPAIPIEVSVRNKVQELKGMLVPKVAAAGLSAADMKLKVQNTGYILKNANSLAFYNIAYASKSMCLCISLQHFACFHSLHADFMWSFEQTALRTKMDFAVPAGGHCAMTVDSGIGGSEKQTRELVREERKTQIQSKGAGPAGVSKTRTPVQGLFDSGTTGTLIRQSLRAKGESILLNLPNPEAEVGPQTATSMMMASVAPPLHEASFGPGSQQAVLVSSHMTWLSFPKVKVEAVQHTSLNQLETKHAKFDGSQERAPLEEQLVGADLASLL